MMNKRRAAIALFSMFVLFQASCSKKAIPVSGSAGLSGEQGSQAGDAGNPLVSDSGELREEALGLTDASSRVEEEEIGSDSLSDAAMRSQSLESITELLDVYFEYDRATLRKGSKEALQENARKLILHPDMKIQIEGHTDSRGSHEYNLALGARRAQTVRRFLAALGVESDRIQTTSFGEEKPFCREGIESCWKQNRRVHFITKP